MNATINICFPVSEDKTSKAKKNNLDVTQQRDPAHNSMRADGDEDEREQHSQS